MLFWGGTLSGLSGRWVGKQEILVSLVDFGKFGAIWKHIIQTPPRQVLQRCVLTTFLIASWLRAALRTAESGWKWWNVEQHDELKISGKTPHFIFLYFPYNLLILWTKVVRHNCAALREALTSLPFMRKPWWAQWKDPGKGRMMVTSQPLRCTSDAPANLDCFKICHHF